MDLDNCETLNDKILSYDILISEYGSLPKNITSPEDNILIVSKLNDITKLKEEINILINSSNILKAMSNIYKYSL